MGRGGGAGRDLLLAHARGEVPQVAARDAAQAELREKEREGDKGRHRGQRKGQGTEEGTGDSQSRDSHQLAPPYMGQSICSAVLGWP